MTATPTTDPSSPLLRRATAKAFRRLLPLLLLCYIVAYVDRSNVGYAKLTMQQDLPAFDNEVIGFGAGLFFLGYFLLEIPGSLLVERWSARKWIARIMLTWGVIAALTAFVKTPNQFYAIRFLLGLAEAGFFPGVVVFLTHWFPQRALARAMAVFMFGTPIAQLASPKICDYLLKFGTTETVDGLLVHHAPLLGLKGWQWVYIAWGLPAVALGLVVLFCLPDRPTQARWLTPEERDALESALAADRAARPAAQRHARIADAFRNPVVLLLVIVLSSITASNYALETFLPTLLRDWYHLDRSRVTTLMLLPPVFALAAQVIVSWSSDRTRERYLHTAACTLLAGVGLALAPLSSGSLALTLLCFGAYAAGNKGSQPPFWALPSLLLTGPAAATATGLINSLGNLGGFFGPSLVGAIERRTGSFLHALYALAAYLLLSGLAILTLALTRHHRSRQP